MPEIKWPMPQAFIAVFLVVALVGLAFALLVVPTPESDIFKTLVGGLMTVGFATVVSYYFGSSAGSKAKEDAIINQLPPPAPPPANGHGNDTLK